MRVNEAINSIEKLTPPLQIINDSFRISTLRINIHVATIISIHRMKTYA